MSKKKTMKRKSWVALVLAIMLIAYNLPVGVFTNVFAEASDEQQVETSQPAATEVEQNPVPPEAPEPGPEPAPEPEIVTHDVSVEKIGDGGGAISINGTAFTGDKLPVQEGPVVIEVTPETGSELKSIKNGVTDIPVTPEGTSYKATIATITNDLTIKVELELKSYTMTFASYNHGKIENQLGQKVTVSGGTDNVKHDNDYSFTVAPDEGYHPEVKIDGADFAGLANATVSTLPDGRLKYTLKNVTKALAIEVNFVINTYVLTFDYDSTKGAVEKGSVRDGIVEEGPSEDTIIAGGGTVTVEHGKRPSFNVTPIEGYHIKSITFGNTAITLPDDVKKETKAYEFQTPQVTSDQDVVVVFEINTYKVTVNDADHGDVSLDKTVVDHDREAVVTMKPDHGYKVSAISVNGSPVNLDSDTNFQIGADDSSSTYLVKNIKNNTSIIVTFAKLPEVEGAWQDFISIEATNGALVDQIDENKLIFSTDAKLTLKPIETTASVIDRIKITINNVLETITGKNWQQSYMVENNSIIEDVQLKSHQQNNDATLILKDDIHLLFDRKKPEIENLVLEGSNKATVDGTVWYSGDVKVNFDLKNPTETFNNLDFSTDIANIYYSKDDAATTEIPVKADKSYSFDAASGNYQSKYKVWALDKAGNKVEAEKTVNIDQKEPQLDGAVRVKQTGSELLNNLTFGMFFKEAIKVTVDVEDVASGIKDIKLIANGKSGEQTISGEISKGSKDRTATATFTLGDESFDGSLALKVTDHVNNTKTYDVTSDNVDPNGKPRFIIDRKAPTAELSVTPDKAEEQPYISENEINGAETEFYSDDVRLNVNVADDAAGVQSVKIKLGDETLKTYDFTNGTEEQLNPTIDPIHTSSLVEKGRLYDFSVAVTDNSGNKNDISQAQKTIYIDEYAPTLPGGKEAVTFELENDSSFAEVLNFLTFGTFFNKQIRVTVKVEDDAAGINELDLHANPEAGQDAPELVRESLEKSGLKAEAVYKMDAEYFKGTLDVAVTDNVGNKRVELVSAANSNMAAIDSGIVMIEKKDPVPSININSETKVKPYVDEAGHQFYRDDVTYDVDAKDADSGVNAVKIDVNGDVVNVDDNEESGAASYYYHDRDQAKLATDNIETLLSNDFKINPDGSYVIRVDAIDNAGNAGHDDETVYIDRTSPVISDFKFAEQGGKDGLQDAIEVMDYGFYFKEPIQVTIGAEDPDVTDDFEATSKVKEMLIYLQDHENGKFYGVVDGTMKEIAGPESVQAIATSSEVKFNVPASFKGQIFAKATDFVDNTGEYVTPDGAVIEDEDKHTEETHIDLHKAETSFKDNHDVELYSGNVNVDLTVTDTYSGIKEIEWSVVAPYDTANNQGGIVKINNDKSYAPGSSPDGWQQTKTDRNLVTEMKKTLTVANNSNDIVVKVKMTDRSGNTSEDEMKFSIDKTVPTMNVTYDNNTPDAGFTDFYKENRTATIVITERNFKPEDVVHAITNTDGVIPKLVGWSTKADSVDPDKTTHTATVAYTADGDYTFDLKYVDNAGNAAAPFAQHKFTLDKTKPLVQVTYNNGASANGNYFKADRTATITITEHNFETSRLKVAGSASDNGAGIGFPATSAWKSNGDVHTATIHYGADGKYSFDIDYTDKAGNMAADYKAEEFVVDQTVPVLEITGVADKSANNGDVAPVVTYSDTNFNKSAVSIKLEGANRGPVALKGSGGDAPNGGVYTFANFEKKKEVDDLYTLTAKLVDFAGNETSKTIRFSVNRFGSVYVFDDSLKAIDGKYVKQEKDVILTETNVDSLKSDSIQVKMTKNGTPTDLAEGKDYSVSKAGGNGSWSQYKYVVKKDLFAGDGRYTVALYSEDLAGNVNETIDETKQAEISFGIDKTAPVVVPVDIESGQQYPVDTKPVTVSVKDNLVLDGAKIYLNNKKVDYKVDGENYSFVVPSANSKQAVKVVAVDAAGNEFTKSVDDFLVSKNLFVRWYNNTPLFLGTIGGVGGIGAIIATASVILNKKRKLVAEEE
ncbi:hypothetical protein HHO41_00215 [Bacillus sp. DNRA2]|uniref:InlB B-repeat-containing protein n=1 Tax=Bacillus sp. DNRA2 TaxID=2723053 RepID=UPI00145DA775|nr:hypothetical protein [Bacillus sp. DNRA2]NMD68691.1 hypothetical protein [Bacillus sp. DNRA2]